LPPDSAGDVNAGATGVGYGAGFLRRVLARHSAGVVLVEVFPASGAEKRGILRNRNA